MPDPSMSMEYVLLILATIICAELFVRLPVFALARRSASYATQSSRVMRSSKISDHWKERALPMYSQRMMLATLKLAGCLIIVLSPFIVGWILATLIHIPFAPLLTSLLGIGVSMAVAFAYVFLRRQIVRR